MNPEKTPYIFDIARGSFVDGPGIRTTVFLKGCPLKCVWCHNPESYSFRPEISWSAASCKLCQQCAKNCPSDAISNIMDHSIDPEKCTACGLCDENCNYNAVRKLGRYYNPNQLVELLMRDKEYYETSGGGVTFSGGEPLMHIPYLEKVCSRLKENQINVSVQTSGYFNFDLFRETLQSYVDIVYFDLKIMDRKMHYEYTGKFNDLILKNLNKLQSINKHKIIIRTPLIPLITDTLENLAAIKSHISNLKIDGYELLRYNPSGKKRESKHVNQRKTKEYQTY